MGIQEERGPQVRKIRPLTPEETARFSDYYQEYYPLILSLARSQVTDRHMAEVVAQETFVTAWERFDVFQVSENPPGWLVMVARNKSREALRDRKQYLEYTEFGQGIGEVVHDLDSLEQVLPETEELRLLRQFYQEGYTLQELADEKQVSLSAMKMRVKRAREKLRKELKNF